MMNYGLGNMMMGGGSAADGAPNLFNAMGAQNNDWLAKAMMAQPMAQPQQQPKKKGFLEQFLMGGGLGLLPAYLMKQL